MERLVIDATLSSEDATAIREILKRRWYTCNPCYGTGWANYRDFRNAPGYEPLAPQVVCKHCDGLGRVHGRDA